MLQIAASASISDDKLWRQEYVHDFNPSGIRGGSNTTHTKVFLCNIFQGNNIKTKFWLAKF